LSKSLGGLNCYMQCFWTLVEINYLLVFFFWRNQNEIYIYIYKYNDSAAPCTRSAKDTTDKVTYSKSYSRSNKQTKIKISRHPYKGAGISTNHDNSNEKKPVLLSAIEKIVV
jgi:hypothetical protein